MSIGKFLQVICVWVQTISYTLGGYFCLRSGGIMAITGAFFIFIGVVHVIKIFNGSILKFQSH
ncbi:MAG: hypothetical protein PHX78_08400 [bacterium]|nr:hypothetical protein [bacterium]